MSITLTRRRFLLGTTATAALPILSSLLYPTPRLASEEDIYEAHLLLGMCAFENNDRLTASRPMAAVRIDTRLDVNATGLRAAAEVESLIARMDVVVTHADRERRA